MTAQYLPGLTATVEVKATFWKLFAVPWTALALAARRLEPAEL